MNPSELTRLDEALDALREKARRDPKGPRVPRKTARKRRRLHVREQRRRNR